MQYIDNINKRTRASMEENVRLTKDRTAWRERRCAAGAANVRTDDAKVKYVSKTGDVQVTMTAKDTW